MVGLEELRQKRLKWVEANRENNFEEGIKRLLTDLYPDNAHFIYELLQNAEDPRASVARFKLTSEALEFEHDGERLFDLRDVESITSIGASTKRDDPTSIGKFGVGFKAVFAYTHTPEIHSGQFHFRIHDLVVPETQGIDEPAMSDRKTRFVFPFDHPTKHPAQAVDEVERALRSLGDNTLLFLNHIRGIEYTLPDGATGSLVRVDHDDGHIEIRSHHPGGNDTVSHWLRFQKDVEVIDGGNSKPCQIGIAFSLVKEDDTKKRQAQWKIVPLHRGQVSIYFPAEKETSNLRFHVHAPFASTVARDSVRDCDANRQLRDRIAERVVESLADIRDRGMLTMGFLAVLPNRTDNLPAFYEPIREAIVRAFKYERLTPTKRGTYALANALFRGPAKISDVIDDEDLSLLTNCAPPLWAANPPQQNQREDRFLDSLKIDSWGWSELSGALSTVDDDNREPIENWIAQKDDAWLMRFYALLGEARNVHMEPVDAKKLSIIRVDAGQGHEHVKPHEAFFSPEPNTTAPRDIRFVKPTVYSTGRSDAQKTFAKIFLDHVGVRPFDAKTVIELRLAHYDRQTEQVDDNHYRDIEQFVAYWKMHPGDVSIFKKHRFLRCHDAEGKLLWREPAQICMDSPFLDTGLANLQEIHKIPTLWDKYRDITAKLDDGSFVKFLQEAGVKTFLPITRVDCEKNPKWSYLSQVPGERFTSPINVDYKIQGLDKILAKPSIQISRLIWNSLCGQPKYSSVWIARYQKNERGGSRFADSQLIHDLREHSWVPQNNGVFVRPVQACRELLPEGFPFDPGWNWLKAIEFGHEAQKKTQEYQLKQAIMRELGFESFDEAAKWKKVKDAGISPDEILQIAQRQRASQPEESVPNPERRRKGVLEHWDNAPSKDSITRGRAIQPYAGQETVEAKAYLRAKYKNKVGQLICQCCHLEMPFKVREVHYFEAVQCVRGLDRHYSENRLALCPTCAAMYQHARETGDEDISRSIIEHDAPDTVSSAEISIRLAGCSFQLRFVGTHWFDLKAVLSKEDDLLQDFISTI